MTVRVCRFLDDALFAHTLVYDEAFVEILANAYPLHERYGVPGHLAVVAGQIGRRRDCYRSSLNGFFHMDAPHLRFLVDRGWSVGNHSYSHFVYPDQPGLDMHREVVYSRYLLEDTIGQAVTYFTIPNNQGNYLPSLPFVKQAGYLGCKIPVTGDLNGDDVDLMQIKGIRLSTTPPPHNYLPDHLRTEQVDLAAVRDTWVIETTHLVQHDPIQAHKNVSCDDLERRLQRIHEIGNGQYWAAVPEDVIDYILMRRHTRVETRERDDRTTVVLDPGEVPVGVRKRTLSLALPSRVSGLSGEKQRFAPVRSSDTNAVFTITGIRARTELRVEEAA